MGGIIETPVFCPYCHQPMQLSAENRDGQGNIINRQYICGCRGGVYFHNVHAGQAGSNR